MGPGNKNSLKVGLALKNRSSSDYPVIPAIQAGVTPRSAVLPPETAVKHKVMDSIVSVGYTIYDKVIKRSRSKIVKVKGQA